MQFFDLKRKTGRVKFTFGIIFVSPDQQHYLSTANSSDASPFPSRRSPPVRLPKPKMHPGRAAPKVDLLAKSKQLHAESKAYADELVASVEALVADTFANIDASQKVQPSATPFLSKPRLLSALSCFRSASTSICRRPVGLARKTCNCSTN